MSVALNMDGDVSLEFTFSETVNISTVDVSQLTVQSKAAGDSTSENHTFSMGKATQNSHTVVTYMPSVTASHTRRGGGCFGVNA